MNIVFLDPAKDELREAVAHYDAQRDGLGDEFAEEADRTAKRLRPSPRHGACWRRTSGAAG